MTIQTRIVFPAQSIIDEAMIEKLVRSFYKRVQANPALAPIFSRVITNWESHLQTMMQFWSSVMLQTGRFKGKPMVKHQALHDARPAHFDVWLGLFEDTAREVCPPEAAEAFIDRAHRIAVALKAGMFGAK